MGQYGHQSQRYPGMANRARRQAQQQIRPAQRQANRESGRIQRQGASAARGARHTYARQASYERGLAQDLHGLGQYTGMAERQLLAGAQQLPKYAEGLATLAQKGARQDVRATQEAVPSLKETAAPLLAQLVQARHEAQKAKAQERKDKREAELADALERRKGMKQAHAAGRQEFDFLVSRIAKDTEGGGIDQLHQQPVRDWLAKSIGSTEGIDLDQAQARQLVERMYRRMFPLSDIGGLLKNTFNGA